MLKYAKKVLKKAKNDPDEFAAGLRMGISLPTDLSVPSRAPKSFFLNFRGSACDCLTFSGPTGLEDIAPAELARVRRCSAAFVLVMIIDSPDLTRFSSGSQASPSEMSASSLV